MRTLEFDVIKQRLRKNPSCDFGGLVAGTVGYLRAKFNFSPEWDSCTKAARFVVRGQSGTYETAALLNREDVCVIPSDILAKGNFYVSVKGVKDGGNYQIETSEIRIKQEVKA